MTTVIYDIKDKPNNRRKKWGRSLPPAKTVYSDAPKTDVSRLDNIARTFRENGWIAFQVQESRLTEAEDAVINAAWSRIFGGQG